MSAITVRPGETVTVIGLPSIPPTAPVDPGYSPPWARPPVDPGYFPPGMGPGQPGGPVDPGYFPPGVGPGRPGGPVDPGYSPPGIGGPGSRPIDPGYGVDVGTGPVRPAHPIALPPSVPPTPEHPWVPPSGPVDPGYFPPGIVAPPPAADGGGNWVWAWLPGVGWRWVRVPGQGEAGPK